MSCDTFRYLERLSDSLLHNLRLSNKATSLARELVTRREGAAAQAEKLEPKLVTISTRTKQLQAHVRYYYGAVRYIVMCGYQSVGPGSLYGPCVVIRVWGLVHCTTPV